MDIKYKAPYPASSLSNFAGHEFEIDGIKCASMEGFLQSLKFQDIAAQVTICLYTGVQAKEAGMYQDWQSKQQLYWNGIEIDRHSEEYQKLLNRAFLKLLENKDFRKALLDSKNERLTHSIGESDPLKTILTETEFCEILMSLRKHL